MSTDIIFLLIALVFGYFILFFCLFIRNLFLISRLNDLEIRVDRLENKLKKKKKK